jgi:hypothetical protein
MTYSSKSSAAGAAEQRHGTAKDDCASRIGQIDSGRTTIRGCSSTGELIEELSA